MLQYAIKEVQKLRTHNYKNNGIGPFHITIYVEELPE